MRPHGKTKLGFYPLPVPEAERLKNCLAFPPEFSALDPCVGDGVAFTHLLGGTQARRYGIEIDADRAEQATRLGIDTLQANTLNVRCPADALSLLYLNPPYDFEIGQANNQRLELVFLEHAYRWLKPGGVLVFVIPQPQLRPCARILSEHFADLVVYKLTEPASVQYKHQKLFPTTVHCSDDAASTETANIPLATQSDTAGLFEGVIDPGSIFVFGRRPESLPGRKRRGRPAVPEQASLFSFG